MHPRLYYQDNYLLRQWLIDHPKSSPVDANATRPSEQRLRRQLDKLL